jgi:twinkle protein
MKDANELLVAGRAGDIIKSFWNAKPFRPDGIVGISDIKDELFTPVTVGDSWPWETLTRITYGRKPGQIFGFGAGVGVGKTDCFTECINHDLNTLGLPVGVIYLEQPVQETVQRIAGKMKSKMFHVPNAGWTVEEYRVAVDELESTKRLWLYRHFGEMGWGVIKTKIQYFAKALGVKHVYLDHLTALVASADDERRALDSIMAQMAGMAQELGIIIHFISHLTTPDGKPHEEGGRVMEKHFTGSRAIARWAHYMFGLERNKQAEDTVERSTTTFRVLKDRFTGQATGKTFQLHYNEQNGRLLESAF